ncbi:PucR family transcriptional regulator [Actinopolyspora mortivallis]|uniref:PucR family transcriptional regulator n=1 Tax=Actinopolyspora mortivallis TaxID=33906 RepID=A0A2T0GVS5_ACTMO|nr:helix-turn-helix domain-containing protein [Actinopolyspora mortivallis]PRW63218.1 PucR family transcriptional regulator [Actinopolyspora mortivallis]
MVDVQALVERVGPTLLRPVTSPQVRCDVADVVIAEPDDPRGVATGDVVLGVGITTERQAVELTEACGGHGAAAVLIKPPLCTADAVCRAAEHHGVGLVEVRGGTAWAQLVWLLRAALAGNEVPDSASEPPRLGSSGAGDLFRLADAVAEMVDAPVTIEDAHSRVLAYSARQDLADPARISTIMGRGQPEDVLAKFRARGTFRQLTKGGSAIYVPEQPDGTLPRLVVPIRMGGELLGSMWAVVTGEVSEQRASAFADTAALVALQLLRHRMLTDSERRRSARLVRLLLDGAEGWRSAANELGVRAEPHRVVAIDVRAGDGMDEGHRLAVWEWITRGVGHRPLVAESGGVLYAVVPDRTGPGGWPALREALLAHIHELVPESSRPLVAAGTAVAVAELPTSRGGADEVLGLLRAGLVDREVAVYEDLWHPLVLTRMAGASADAGIGELGPLGVLREHDRNHGTEYLNTLYSWLRRPGDPRTASRELRVHPNTFRYRMKRLNELVEVDLDDPEVRAALLVQLLSELWNPHGRS